MEGKKKKEQKCPLFMLFINFFKQVMNDSKQLSLENKDTTYIV